MKRQPSISVRLFLFLFIAGLLTLLSAGAVLYHEVQELLAENMDQALRSDIEIFIGLLDVEEGRADLDFSEAVSGKFSLPHSGHYYQILRDGKSIARSSSLKNEELKLLPKQMIAQDPKANLKFYESVGPAHEPLRAIEKSVPQAGHHFLIRLAYSQTENLKLLHSLRNFLFIFGLMLTFILAILGWAISRRALRPLREFSVRVNHIGEATLDERMDLDSQYLELATLASAFNAMLERLKKSLQGREALLSDVSHELKTPITVIRSCSDIYLQKKRPTAEYIESLELIRDTADSMGQKIRRLLGFAQTEADLMRAAARQAVNLEDCLHKACVTVKPLARQRGITLTERLSARLTVTGNAERLVEAFANLLENAIKYNKPEGQVTVSSERLYNQALIQIEDSGQGIPPEDIDHIFERFYRSTNTSESEGSGLGLALVKTIIEAHNGQIEVQSELGKGTWFQISLPLA